MRKAVPSWTHFRRAAWLAVPEKSGFGQRVWGLPCRPAGRSADLSADRLSYNHAVITSFNAPNVRRNLIEARLDRAGDADLIERMVWASTGWSNRVSWLGTPAMQRLSSSIDRYDRPDEVASAQGEPRAYLAWLIYGCLVDLSQIPDTLPVANDPELEVIVPDGHSVYQPSAGLDFHDAGATWPWLVHGNDAADWIWSQIEAVGPIDFVGVEDHFSSLPRFVDLIRDRAPDLAASIEQLGRDLDHRQDVDLIRDWAASIW